GPAHVIDQARPGAGQPGPGTDESQRPIGAGAPDPDRGEQRGIPPPDARQIGGIDPIRLVLVVIEPAQLPAVRDEHFVTQGRQLPTHPPRVGPRFEHHPGRRARQALAQRDPGRRDPVLLDHDAILVHDAELTEAVADIETHRYVPHRANLRANGPFSPWFILEDPPTRIPRSRQVGLLISIFSRALRATEAAHLAGGNTRAPGDAPRG